MLAFVDESGDPGMKLERGSSRLFAVGIVTFDDRAEAEACDERISKLRGELSLARNYEFHFARNSKRVRREFLGAVSHFQFQYHVFALEKAHVNSPGFQHKDSLYKWTARTAFENAKPFLVEATVTLDKCGDRQFRDQFAAYLRQRINPKSGERHIAKVKLQDSHANNLLQLADYVVGVGAGALQGHTEETDLRRRFLVDRERSQVRWPKRQTW